MPYPNRPRRWYSNNNSICCQTFAKCLMQGIAFPTFDAQCICSLCAQTNNKGCKEVYCFLANQTLIHTRQSVQYLVLCFHHYLSLFKTIGQVFINLQNPVHNWARNLHYLQEIKISPSGKECVTAFFFF